MRKASQEMLGQGSKRRPLLQECSVVGRKRHPLLQSRIPTENERRNLTGNSHSVWYIEQGASSPKTPPQWVSLRNFHQPPKNW